jgi:purine nucleoside phosphorylase
MRVKRREALRKIAKIKVIRSEIISKVIASEALGGLGIFKLQEFVCLHQFLSFTSSRKTILVRSHVPFLNSHIGTMKSFHRSEEGRGSKYSRMKNRATGEV